MNLTILLDPLSAGIVLGGTLLATAMRAGRADCRTTLAQLARLGRRRFDPEAVRAELARQAQEIRRDGLLRAQPHHFGDPELDEASEAMIARRSVDGLVEAHEAYKARRMGRSTRAVRTLAQAAELAPVFGLAGTLVSLSQLPATGLGRGALMGTIAMAVVTTLYGLLAANLLFAPLARLVERRAQAEEAARQDEVDWMVRQVGAAAARPVRLDSAA